MLKIVETLPGQLPTEREIDLDNLPATIGRGTQADYQVAVGVDPTQAFFRALSRIHATVIQDAEEQLWLQDGGRTPSESGIYFGGKRVTRSMMRLYPGVEYELMPEFQGYRLVLQWPAEAAHDDYPTIGLEQENAELKVRLSESDSKIQEMAWQLSELRKLYLEQQDKAQTFSKRVDSELRSQRSINQLQDKRLKIIKRCLLVLAALGMIGAFFLLGADHNLIEQVGGLVLAISSLVGAIATLTGEPETE